MARTFPGGDVDTDVITTTYTTNDAAKTVAFVVNRTGRGGNLKGAIYDKGSDERFSDLTSAWRIERKFSTTNGTWDVTVPSGFEYVIMTYDESSVSNDPVVYYSAVSQTVTEATAPAGTATTNANAYLVGNVSSVRCFQGDIALFAIWNRILSTDEINTLSADVWRSPLFIRNGLVEYIDMVRSVRSYKQSLTLTGTTVAAHPRIIYPRRNSKIISFTQPTAASTGKGATFINYSGMLQMGAG